MSYSETDAFKELQRKVDTEIANSENCHMDSLGQIKAKARAEAFAEARNIVKCIDSLAEIDANDPATWDTFTYAGTKFRIYDEIVDTDHGPENLVKVWSPVTCRIIEAQEPMARLSIAIRLINGEL